MAKTRRNGFAMDRCLRHHHVIGSGCVLQVPCRSRYVSCEVPTQACSAIHTFHALCSEHWTSLLRTHAQTVAELRMHEGKVGGLLLVEWGVGQVVSPRTGCFGCQAGVEGHRLCAGRVCKVDLGDDGFVLVGCIPNRVQLRVDQQPARAWRVHKVLQHNMCLSTSSTWTRPHGSWDLNACHAWIALHSWQAARLLALCRCSKRSCGRV